MLNRLKSWLIRKLGGYINCETYIVSPKTGERIEVEVAMPYDGLLSLPFESALYCSLVEQFSRKLAEQLVKKFSRANISITEDSMGRKRWFKLAVYVDFLPCISKKKLED